MISLCIILLQLKGYAQSQSSTPAVDNTYMGRSIEGENVKIRENHIKYNDIDPVMLIKAVYAVPFSFVAFFFITSIGIACCKDKLEILTDNPSLLGKIVASLLICVIFTVFIAILDIKSVVEEKQDLPSYYPENAYALYEMTIIFLIFDLLTLVIACAATFVVLIMICTAEKRNCCEAIQQSVCGGVAEETDCGGKVDVCARIKENLPVIAVIMIVGSFVVSLASHFPYILMAWATDPSRIAFFYGIVVFSYFVTFFSAFYTTHNFPLGKHRCVHIIVIGFILIVSGTLVTGVLITLAMFVAVVPVNNSIETAAEGVTTIYNGVVVLIGALIAYRIGWHYIIHSFSISEAIKQALKEIKSSKNEWNKLPEEQILSKIVKNYISKELI